MHQRAGFTLIELLMVIVLLGIVATVSVRFVSLSTQGALDVSARHEPFREWLYQSKSPVS
jgi:MSHA biogenesis protein MshO